MSYSNSPDFQNNYGDDYRGRAVLHYEKVKSIIFLLLIFIIAFGLNFSLAKGDDALGFMNKLTRVLITGLSFLSIIFYSLTDKKMITRYKSLYSRSFLLLLFWIIYTLSFAREEAKSFQTFYGVFTLLIFYALLFSLIETRQMFNSILLKFVLTFLAVNYAAIIFIPGVAIHSDDGLSGLWRGVIMHKNTAGPLVAYILFIGIYLWKNNYRKVGWIVIFFAGLFSYNAGSKTVIIVEVIVIVAVQIAFSFKNGFTRSLVLLTPLILLSSYTMASVFNVEFHDYLNYNGISTDYTGRDKLWILAVDFIKDLEHHGLGFGSYLLTEQGEFFKNNVKLDLSWADNFHNSYLEAYVSLGLTGFILVILFLVIMPLRAINQAVKRGNNKTLIMLFTSMWLLLLHSATMESVFFGQFNPGWALFIFAIFALRRLALEKLPE